MADRNCQSCDNYKDEYCSELDMKPCYPEKGCDYFSRQNKLKKDTMQILDEIRAEIEQKIEQERFAHSVFRGEEKDDAKAEQCTGSIFAYNNVIRLINKYKAEGIDAE